MQDDGSRRSGRLWLLLALAGGYLVLLRVQPQITGIMLLDGTLGLALGLYICSHPAAAAIDLFYLDRAVLQRLASEWSDVGWLALNLLVMVAGCVVAIAGATQFVGPGR